MSSSDASSNPPPSPSSEFSDRDRFLLLLLRQSRELLRSLPESLEKSSASLMARLHAISQTESAERETTLNACLESRDESRVTQALLLSLIETMRSLDKKLDSSSQTAAVDRMSRQRLEAKVDQLSFQLAELNDYVPR